MQSVDRRPHRWMNSSGCFPEPLIITITTFLTRKVKGKRLKEWKPYGKAGSRHKLAWPIARPSESTGFRSHFIGKNTTQEHHEHPVVESPLPIGSCRSLRWASAENARGGTPSDSKLGDMATSGYFHPPSQRSPEWDCHQSLATRAIVWNARSSAFPSGQGESPLSCTGFGHIGPFPACLGW